MASSLIRNFRMLARYNTLANRGLYETCACLGDAERKEDRPAFFGSIHGTLNHIIIGDRLWLARFGGEEVPSTNLDAVLYEDFDELRGARVSEDERIKVFAFGLNEELLGGTIRYANNEGKIYIDPRRPAGRTSLQPSDAPPRADPRHAHADRGAAACVGSAPHYKVRLRSLTGFPMRMGLRVLSSTASSTRAASVRQSADRPESLVILFSRCRSSW